MAIRARQTLVAFTLLATLGMPSTASAEPVPFCTTSAVAVASFGPCVFDGKLFSDFTARVGTVDLMRHPFFSMTASVTDYPHDPFLVPHFNVLSQEHVAFEVTPQNPLEVRFTVTALSSSAPLSFAYILLTNPWALDSPEPSGLS